MRIGSWLDGRWVGSIRCETMDEEIHGDWVGGYEGLESGIL